MLYNQNWNRPSNPVSDLLLKAADLIEKHGHTKRQLYGDNGSMCFMGALHRANGTNLHTLIRSEWPELLEQAAIAVQTTMDIPNHPHVSHCPVHAVVEWNNAPERTGQEVIDAMRLAAKTVVPV